MDHLELPHVPSPYEGRRLTVIEHLQIASFWFGSNVLWAAFLVVILPKQMADLGGAQAAILAGKLIGIGAVIALIVPLLVGPISDRCTSKWGRRRPFIAVGTLVNLLGLGTVYAAGEAKSFGMYLGGFLLMQLGNNIATGAYTGIIPDLIPENQRGVASGYMGFMTQIGTAIGAIGSALLIGKSPMIAFAFIGTLLALSGCLTVFGIKENPLPHRIPFPWSRYFRSLWIDPKQHSDFAWVWITRALVMLGFYMVQPELQYYLRDVIGVQDAAKTSGLLIVVVLIGATITGLWGGHASEKHGRKNIVYMANSFMALTALAFPFCRTLLEATIVAVFFGLGYGAYVSVDWALGTDVLPDKKHAGKDMAVWHVSMVLPQSLAAPLAGLVLLQMGTWKTMQLEVEAPEAKSVRISTSTGIIDAKKDGDSWRAHFPIGKEAETFTAQILKTDPTGESKQEVQKWTGEIDEVKSARDSKELTVINHYTKNGYISIFGLAALCLGLGAMLLRNVRGAR